MEILYIKKAHFAQIQKRSDFLTKYIDEMLEKLYAKLHNLEKDCRRIKKLIKELEKIKRGEYFDGL